MWKKSKEIMDKLEKHSEKDCQLRESLNLIDMALRLYEAVTVATNKDISQFVDIDRLPYGKTIKETMDALHIDEYVTEIEYNEILMGIVIERTDDLMMDEACGLNDKNESYFELRYAPK